MNEPLNKTQYANSSNMRKRGNIHAKYGNRSWFGWVGSQIKLRPGDKVLDAGCGAGWYWKAIANSVPKIDLNVLDNSNGMVKEALANLSTLPCFSSLEARTDDIVSMPYESDSFDHVLAMHMLYHVENTEAAIAEMRRVVKPGGTVYVTTNTGKNLEELYRLGSDAFGGSNKEPVAALFSEAHAATLMSAHFEAVTTHKFVDNYQINDGSDIFGFLTSFPPGITASEERKQNLKHFIDTALSEGDGLIETNRESILVSGRKPL